MALAEKKLFLVFFFYSCLVASAIQLLVLPHLVPHLHAGHGLLTQSDSVVIDEIARETAQEIKREGWSKFELKSKRGNRGLATQVAILFYYFIYPEPYTLIPLNAFIHAVSAFLIVFILLRLNASLFVAVCGAVPFLILPSAVSWYAQILKDGYAILGFLLVLHGWLRFSEGRSATSALELLFGFVLILLSRPDIVQILGVISPVIAVFAWMKYRPKLNTKDSVWTALLVCFLLYPFLLHTNKDQEVAAVQSAPFDPLRDPRFQDEPQYWNETGLPNAIERKLFSLAVRRDGSRYRPNTKNIDDEVRFHSATDIVKYIPRAFQIAFLSPFPSDWFSEGSSAAGGMMRRLVAFEMVLVYIGLFCLVLNLPKFLGNLNFWIISLLCGVPLLVYALVITNIGALYRYRYGYLMVLVGIGFMSLGEFLRKKVEAHSKAY